MQWLWCFTGNATIYIRPGPHPKAANSLIPPITGSLGGSLFTISMVLECASKPEHLEEAQCCKARVLPAYASQMYL